jgi:hypothetical protein
MLYSIIIYMFHILLTVSTARRLGPDALWTNKCYKTDQATEGPTLWNGHAEKSSTRIRSTEVWQTYWSGLQKYSGCH